MRIALIEIEPMIKYPPTISVLKNLIDLGHDISLYTLTLHPELKKYCEDNKVEIHELGKEYVYKVSVFNKLINLIHIRKVIWNLIDTYENKETLLWVFSTITLKHLGRKLLKRNYILHLFELVENLYYFNHYFPINLQLYCKNAKDVVVCEYNRAHITKTWMHLNKLPFVLPNKPYIDDIVKNNKITSSEEVDSLIRNLSNKKIILYQGIIDKERPLETFIHAIDSLGDEYAFLIMSDHNPYANIKSKNCYFINYIPAPKHLEVTSHAFIGVLSYVPNYDGYSSPLNSIYCAPNKTYEYAAFGIPMIGNDIPGLTYSLEYNKMGVCVDISKQNEIIAAIKNIEKEYLMYSKNSLTFYDKANVKEIINEILLNKENIL